MMATDPTLLDATRALVAGGEAPGRAIRLAGETLAEPLAALGDPILAARAADVRDVAARVARTLAGEVLELPRQPSIVAADDLPPSVTAEIPAGPAPGDRARRRLGDRPRGDPRRVARDPRGGRCRRAGPAPGPRRHRRAARRPASGHRRLDRRAPAGPQRRRRAPSPRRCRPSPTVSASEAPRMGPFTTMDGRRVHLLANIGRPEEAEAALRAGAEGVGLFRTEFLFLGRLRPPTEDEQAAAYRRVFETFGPDAARCRPPGGHRRRQGGALPGAAGGGEPVPRRPRPAPGTRGAGAARDPAPCRAPGGRRRGRRALGHGADGGDTRGRGAARGAAARRGGRVGTPAEARGDGRGPGGGRAGTRDRPPGRLHEHRDQRPHAVPVCRGPDERAARRPTRTPGTPPCVRSVAAVVAAGREAGIPVAVCGELAGDPGGARLLAGLGVEELSMAPRAIAGVADAIARSTLAELEGEAAAAIG